MSFFVEVWGDYASFNRPEMKVERVSYDVITPSAARGLIEAIYWHPGMRWIIDRIYVCNPIRFTNIRRNELDGVLNARDAKPVMLGTSNRELYFACSEHDTQQRAAMILRDVRYVIETHFEMTDRAADGDNPGKFADIFRRRLEKGQMYHQPCFGTREFAANFRICRHIPDCPPELKGEQDLGWMLYDMDYSDKENIKPMFFRATMRNGVIDVPRIHSEEVKT